MSKPVHILGLNAYHADASACLVSDGVLIAAAEEERFRRIKHWAGFPSEAICYCLEAGGIGLDEVAHVAINRDPRANLWRKAAYSMATRPSFDFLRGRLKNARKWAGVEEELAAAFPGQHFAGVVHNVEHHRAHLASAFLLSPFEDATVVSIDGFGDFSSAAWGRGRNGAIHMEGRVFFPHSLGLFYQALTQHLGFPHYGDEYKVMGLAPYGEPRFMDQMRRIVALEEGGGFELNLRFFRHASEGIVYEWTGGSPVIGTLFTPALEELLGPARAPDAPLEQRHKNLARSIQAMFEEAVFHLYNTLHRRHAVDAIAIAGGCGFNSVANGRLYHRTPYRRCYVQAAAGDSGGAVGAAYDVWQRHAGKSARRFLMDHAYWGPEFGDSALSAAIAARRGEIDAKACSVEKIAGAALYTRTAAAIAAGKVIGWFQGRLEWGPRALGNRSILADPRRADMKGILNLKIKRRESFRPFAPSILREAVPDWFETDDDVPFMMQVFQIREDKRPRIPAVTHVDGSGRLQTVTRETNERYYKLIQAFAAETGVPMVLNTSFNENEPVVCKPEEALDCFLRTNMDVLVLGDYLIERRAATSS
jgi:carbamoyltransferase